MVPHCVGRCSVLPEAVSYTAHCYSKYTLQGSHATLHALKSPHLPDRHLPICRCTGRKVRTACIVQDPSGSFMFLLFRIVASLVRAQFVPFLFNILRWLLVAIPATWTNSWLSYVENKLALAYRTRLTREVMKQYLGDESDPTDLKTFYKLANLDDRVKNPDQ